MKLTTTAPLMALTLALSCLPAIIAFAPGTPRISMLRASGGNHRQEQHQEEGARAVTEQRRKLLLIQRIAQENSLPPEELLSLFEGDIVPDYESIFNSYGEEVTQRLVDEGLLSPATSKAASSKGLSVDGRWSTRVNDVVEIPYTIDTAYFGSRTDDIINAINELSDRIKVVKFVPWTSEIEFIEVIESTGCASYVGRKNLFPQPIWLNNPGCLSKGTIQHEFMHAMGVWHEQSRPDRDDFVTIHYENIKEGRKSAFDKRADAQSLGSAYEYGSVMHYGNTFFSKNGAPTITAPVPIGQRIGATDEDILQLQLLYQCVSGERTKAAAASTPCSNDCKCWLGATGCGTDSNTCQGDLICFNNECIDASTTPAPTTSAPTTSAPTTAAPTTAAPTTAAPTSDAPTTTAPTTNNLISDSYCSHELSPDKDYPNICDSCSYSQSSSYSYVQTESCSDPPTSSCSDPSTSFFSDSPTGPSSCRNSTGRDRALTFASVLLFGK